MGNNQLQWKQCHITNVINNKVFPHTGPILYKWWFHEDSKIMKVLRTYGDYIQFERIEKKIIDDTCGTYYALYLGKGINGKRRLKSHLSKHKRTSTLRRTISALLQTIDENEITNSLSTCYYEWCELDCDNVCLENIEKEEIEKGYFPLNLKDNPNTDNRLKEVIRNNRKTFNA